MQTQTVTKPRKPAPPPSAVVEPPADTTETPPLTFAEIGRLARQKAQRDALLAQLEQLDWNLTATAKALGMAHASSVSRAIEELGLETLYEAAKAKKAAQK